MMEQYKIDFESMVWEAPAVGVKFKAYEQGGNLEFELVFEGGFEVVNIVEIVD